MANANHNIIKNLASRLVKNQLKIDLAAEEQSSIINNHDSIQTSSRRKVIAVIGAGASVEAGLPLASRAVTLLKNEMFVNRAWDQRVFNARLEELEQVSRLNKNEFETVMLALSDVNSKAKEVRNYIAKLYNKRYHPILSNEILAHLFKHRFIDAIINFNFDELLDQSIADELKPGEYVNVLTDGDCPNLNSEGIYGLPIYIKPHGTVSHKSTLRFTRKDYFGIPIDIRGLIESLLSGPNVTLLVIGFNMQSAEFNEIIRKKKSNFDIFYISLGIPIPKPDLEYTDENESAPESPGTRNQYLIPVEGGQKDLSLKLQDLWKNVVNSYKHHKPRGVERHELIYNLFAPLDFKSNERSKAQRRRYLHDRTLVEIALSTAKGKGLLNMSVLLNDRCGEYYDLYSKDDPNHKTLFELCQDLGLEEIGYSRDTLRLKIPDRTMNDAGVPEVGIVIKNDFKNNVKDFVKRISKFLQSDDATRNIQNNFPLFVEVLNRLYEETEIEMSITEEKDYNKIYNKPSVIYTETGFRYITEKLIKNTQWDFMLVSAETGEWLLQDNIEKLIKNHQKNKVLSLVIADGAYKKDIEKRYGKKIGKIRELAWWEHNRHMTILVKNFEPIVSIYFARRLRTPYVTPVLLKDADSRVVFQYFVAYWKKADEMEYKWFSKDDLDQKGFFDSLTESED